MTKGIKTDLRLTTMIKEGDATDTEGSASENDNETESDMPDCEVLGQLFSQKSKNKRSSGTRTMRYQRWKTYKPCHYVNFQESSTSNHTTSDLLNLIEIDLDEGEKDMVVDNIHVDADVAL